MLDLRSLETSDGVTKKYYKHYKHEFPCTIIPGGGVWSVSEMIFG